MELCCVNRAESSIYVLSWDSNVFSREPNEAPSHRVMACLFCDDKPIAIPEIGWDSPLCVFDRGLKSERWRLTTAIRMWQNGTSITPEELLPRKKLVPYSAIKGETYLQYEIDMLEHLVAAKKYELQIESKSEIVSGTLPERSPNTIELSYCPCSNENFLPCAGEASEPLRDSSQRDINHATDA